MPGQVFLDIQLSSRRDSGFSQAFSRKICLLLLE
jgi:hypothetical protein